MTETVTAEIAKLKLKAEAFWKRNQVVHIVRSDSEFIDGYIAKIEDDCIWINRAGGNRLVPVVGLGRIERRLRHKCAIFIGTPATWRSAPMFNT